MRPPTTRAAVERREAQGSSQGPARPGTPIPSRHVGSRKFGAFRPADRKAGQGSLASSLAPPGAPSPRFEGNGKQGYGRTLAARTKRRGGGALAIGGEGKMDGLASYALIPPPCGEGGRAEATAERGRVGNVSHRAHPTRFALGFPPREPPSPQGGGIACSPRGPGKTRRVNSLAFGDHLRVTGMGLLV